MKNAKFWFIGLLISMPVNAYQKICKPLSKKITEQEIEKDHRVAYSFVMLAETSPDRNARNCQVYLTSNDVAQLKKDLGIYSSEDEITLEMIQTQNPENVTGKVLADYRGFEIIPGPKTVAPVYQMLTRYNGK